MARRDRRRLGRWDQRPRMAPRCEPNGRARCHHGAVARAFGVMARDGGEYGEVGGIRCVEKVRSGRRIMRGLRSFHPAVRLHNRLCVHWNWFLTRMVGSEPSPIAILPHPEGAALARHGIDRNWLRNAGTRRPDLVSHSEHPASQLRRVLGPFASAVRVDDEPAWNTYLREGPVPGATARRLHRLGPCCVPVPPTDVLN